MRLWPLIGMCLIACAALAHGPEDTDPAMADWFRSLAQPDKNHGSCCSERDCHVLASADLQVRDGVYWIKDPDEIWSHTPEWLAVPKDRILTRYDNPTGKYVACVHIHQVLCFVKAAAT